MKLVITIDTEEDNWGQYTPQGATLRNLQHVPALQALFDEFGAMPTYLITYPVATSKDGQSILSQIYRAGRCEIGAHCHPWNTPPFNETLSRENSWLCNLPSFLQLQKIRSLTEAIDESLGVRPLCFRAGRWGFSEEVARHLTTLGYKVDTSITPYIDWTEGNGPNFGSYSCSPFRYVKRNLSAGSSEDELLEIPATVGFLQGNASRCNRILRMTKGPILRHFRLSGILDRLSLVNKVWLTPELCDASSMIRMAEVMRRRGCPIANLSFHSTTLVAGLTPFVTSIADESVFMSKIREFLLYAREAGLEMCALTSAAQSIEATYVRQI
jgi:hypothetical protein